MDTQSISVNVSMDGRGSIAKTVSHWVCETEKKEEKINKEKKKTMQKESACIFFKF